MKEQRHFLILLLILGAWPQVSITEGAIASGVTAIAAGWFHSVALKSDGTVVTWGRS